MASVRSVAQCLGLGSTFSIQHDLFGFKAGIPVVRGAPPQLSLLDHVTRLTRGSYANLNLIRTGSWSTRDFRTASAGVHLARELYRQAGVTIGRVLWYTIPAGDLAVIDSQTEVEQMMMGWSVSNDGVDCFLVTRTLTGWGGLAPPIGTCWKDSIVKDGVMVALYNGSLAWFGHALAHELGHFFGLPHVTGSTNLMYERQLIPGTSILLDASQIWFMNAFCAIKDGCSG